MRRKKPESRSIPRLVFQLPNLQDPTSGFEGGLEFAKQILESRPSVHCRARLRRSDGAGRCAWPYRGGIAGAGRLLRGGIRRCASGDRCDARHHDDSPAAQGDGVVGRGMGGGGESMRASKAKRSPARLHKALPELVVRMSTSPRRSCHEK